MIVLCFRHTPSCIWNDINLIPELLELWNKGMSMVTFVSLIESARSEKDWVMSNMCTILFVGSCKCYFLT